MDELSRWVAEARAHVEVPWDAAREARIRARVDGERRRPRRRALVPALAAAAVVGSAAAAWAWVATDAGGGPAVGTAPGSLTLADGSRIDVEGPDGRVTVLAERPQETTVRLEAGAARFDVVPRARRRFRVRARDVEVAVIGTVFEVVDRRSTVEVRVLRGRVRVAWAGGQEVRSAPARGLYPDQGGERSPRAGPDPRAAATGRSAARAPGARPGAEAAARLAARGEEPGSGGAEGGAGSV
ncbi:MAG: FecR domain-containing protein, partial [Sandaracinaceae bacterium]